MFVKKNIHGLTLIELLAGIVLLAILCTLLLGAFSGARARSERIKCMSHLRAFHTGLAAYTQSKGHWPQLPEDLSEEAEEQWWIDELKTVGITEDVWLCPTLKRLMAEGKKKSASLSKIDMHYVITNFDEKPFTPYKWSGQPWAAEAGDNHGNGALIIFPDGSIRSFNDVVESP